MEQKKLSELERKSYLSKGERKNWANSKRKTILAIVEQKKSNQMGSQKL